MYEPLTLHVLNVQMPIVSGGVRAFVDSATIRRFHQDEGETALAKARAVLDAAGVPYTAEVKVGNIAETIVATARDNHCDQIVMGTRGLGTHTGALLGSVTRETLEHSRVPVLVVK
jgi:nucleotide-binding universal stress UspA family protein